MQVQNPKFRGRCLVDDATEGGGRSRSSPPLDDDYIGLGGGRKSVEGWKERERDGGREGEWSKEQIRKVDF